MYYLLALSAVAAQFPGLDQFRWPGWFLCGHALFLFLLTLFNFREKKDDMNREGKSCAPKKLLLPKYVSSITAVFIITNCLDISLTHVIVYGFYYYSIYTSEFTVNCVRNITKSNTY